MKKKILTGLAMIALSGSSFAATANNNMKASAIVEKSCLVAVTDAEFGEYSPTATEDKLTKNSVTLKCSKGTAWNFYTYAAYFPYTTTSPNSSGYASRMLSADGKSFLYYQVKMSDGMWDNDVDLPGRVNMGHFVGTGTGAEQNFDLEYRVFKNQFVAEGNYVDKPTAYVDF